MTGKIAKDTNVPSNDCISRQAAIDAIEVYFDGLPIVVHHDMSEMIRRLPATVAQPHSRNGQGRWIEEEDYNGDTIYKCSECGEEFVLIDGTPKDNNYFFCPKCGADMREDINV